MIRQHAHDQAEKDSNTVASTTKKSGIKHD
jgi:hypothetical protein